MISAAATVTMETDEYTFDEDSGTVAVCAELTALAVSLECDVIATLTLMDGSKASKLDDLPPGVCCSYTVCYIALAAARNVDYGAVDPLSVTFSAQPFFLGATACANVTIIDDDALEGNHSFTVTVSSLELSPGGMYSGLEIGMPSSATVNIMDNDGMIWHSEGDNC